MMNSSLNMLPLPFWCLNDAQRYGYKGNGVHFPSVMELSFLEQMQAQLLPRAWQHIRQTFLETYSRFLTEGNWLQKVLYKSLIKYDQEVYALLMALIQAYFLQQYDGLLSEKFYGLHRVKMKKMSTEMNLKGVGHVGDLCSNKRWKTLALTVFVPYIVAKLNQAHAQMNVESEANTNAEAQSSDRDLMFSSLLKPLIRLYPMCRDIGNSSSIVYQWLYMFGLMQYPSISMHYLGVILKRTTNEDLARFTARIKAKRQIALQRIPGTNFFSALKRAVWKAAWTSVDYTPLAVLAMAGLFQVLTWYYTDDSSSPRFIQKNALVPPPPSRPSKATALVSIPMNPEICPLCTNVRVNATADTSGFVFCYPCIFNFVKVHRKSPVTQQPCTLDNIRRIYETATSTVE